MTAPSFTHVADHPHIRAIERALAAERSHREAAMNNRQFAEAFNLHTQALLIRQQLDDPGGILHSFCMAGHELS